MRHRTNLAVGQNEASIDRFCLNRTVTDSMQAKQWREQQLLQLTHKRLSGCGWNASTALTEAKFQMLSPRAAIYVLYQLATA